MYRVIVTRPDGTTFQTSTEPLPDRHATGLAVLRTLADEGAPCSIGDAKRFGARVRDAELGVTLTHDSGYQFRAEAF